MQNNDDSEEVEELAKELWSIFDDTDDEKWPNLIPEHKEHYLVRARHLLTEGYRKHPTSPKQDLVPLDEKNIKLFFYRRCPRSVPLDKQEMDSLAEDLCKFIGHPRQVNSCKCKRHPDSAFTVRVIDNVPICPKCGGIIILKPKRVTADSIEKIMHNEHYRLFHLMSPEIAGMTKKQAQAIADFVNGERE